MLGMVLKNVGDLLPIKAMTSAAIRGKSHTWKLFPRLQAIVDTEHVCGLGHEPKSIFADAVMMALVSPFSFGKYAQDIANTRGWIRCARRRILDHADDASRQ